MKARKNRQLSESEQQARNKCDGLTRREYRAKNSKFKSRDPNARSGNFEIAALFYGNDMPQKHTFDNLVPALSHFAKLATKDNVSVLKLIEYVRKDDSNDVRAKVLHQLNKAGQVFANSTIETLWFRRSDPHKATFGKKALLQSPKLYEAYVAGQLEVAREIAVGGEPWWERRA